MSIQYGSRVRKRIRPLVGVKDRNIDWRYSIELTPNSSNWKEYNHTTQSLLGSWPYEEAEICWDETHAGPPFTSGGPFHKLNLEYTKPVGALMSGQQLITNSAGYVVTPFGNGRIKYVGGFLPPGDWPAFFETDIGLSFAKTNNPHFYDMSGDHTTAWDKTKPRIESGGLFVAVAELKDIPRMFQTTAKGFKAAWDFSHSLFVKDNLTGLSKRAIRLAPKRAADHFINHNFGWVPFVQDVANFLSNLRDFREKIERLSRENGQWIRRRSVIRDVFIDEVIPGWSGTGIHNVWPLNTSPTNDTWVGTPTWEYRHKFEWHVDAIGKFRYYIPEFDVNSPEWGGLGSVRRQLAIHGARVNPYHIYQAVPWSWLVDWLTPVGHDLKVLQDSYSDNLVAEYLFLTSHLVETVIFKQFVPFNAASGGPKTLVWTRKRVVKQREKADSPFGFGLTWDQLSPKQLAILAALGILRT